MNKRELSTHIKARVLEKGVRFNNNALKGLGTIYKEEHHGYDNSNWGIKKEDIVPSEIMLPGEIVVCVHVRPDSPYEIKRIDQKLYLYEDNEAIIPVKYLPRPKVWRSKLKDGTNIKKVVNFYGYDCLNINIYSGCEFWDKGVPCKFCSVSPTQKMFKDAIIKKSLPQIRDAVERAFSSGDKISFVLTTGGSTTNPDVEFDSHVSALNVIKEFSPWKNRIKGNTALMPPLNHNRIKNLYDTGMEHPSFNLEVWGKSLFKDICPGKEIYRGYDHILKSYTYSVREFYGEGKMWCNFVAGINRLEDLKKGFDYIAEMGVIPGANVFHPDVGAILGQKLKTPSYEYIKDLYQHAADLYRAKGYKPFFSESVLRNSLANEAYKGWI